MIKTVIFNGPPDSGKDFICEVLSEKFEDATHLQIKRKLFSLVFEIFCISESEFMALYDDRILKESPCVRLRGMSPREAMIFVSERMIKPNFDKLYFGESAALQLKDGWNFFSDGGFYEEMIPIFNASDRFAVIRLHREGRTFEGDSRTYLDPNRLHNIIGHSIDFGDVVNTGDKSFIVDVERMIKRFGWE